MQIINKILQITFRQTCPDLIADLNKNFNHKRRPCHYGRRRILVDSFNGEAAPGVAETVILKLDQIRKDREGQLRLLNLGGGVGQLSDIFSNIGFDVTNTDIAIENPDEKNINVNFNNTTELPFSEESFDVIVCQEVIEHVENPWNIFRMVKRCLKKDGKFFLTTPNILSYRSKTLLKKSGYFKWFEPKDHSYHVNPIPWWEILLIAEKTGFNVTDIRGNGDFFFEPTKKINIKSVLAKNDILIFEATT